MKLNKFRLSAVNLYLTYPKCNLGLDKVLDQLKEHLSTQIIKDYVIVREFHQDNTLHIHAYVKCARKVNIVNPNRLDLKNPETGETYHGNYQPAKLPNKVIQYIMKDISHTSF